MTEEAYPKSDEFNLISNLVESYLDFIQYLKKARNANIDNEMLIDILNLFYIVKIDDETINELKIWLDKLGAVVVE